MKNRILLLLLGLLLLNCSMRSHTADIILEDGFYFNGKKFVAFAEMEINSGKIIAINTNKTGVEGKRISIKGKYVIPGLIDAHVHLSGSPAYPYVNVDALFNMNSSLRCGVTTNIDLFFIESMVNQYKDSAARHMEKYATFITSGPILTAPGGHGTEYGVPTRTITNVKEAEQITEEVASQKNIDVIKLVYDAYSEKNFLTKEMVAKIVEVAHKYNKKVFAHINIAKEAMDCIDARVDVLAHMPYDKMDKAQLDKLKKSKIPVISTISVYESLCEGHDAGFMGDSLLWNSAFPQYMENFQRTGSPKILMQNLFGVEPGYHDNLKNCIKMNIPVLAGTDAGNFATFYGYSLHNEMLLYCKSGMKNAEAINSATLTVSNLFPGWKTGKIEAGYVADLVVLNADPLKDIKNTRKINFTIHHGKVTEKVNFDVPKIVVPPLVFDPSVFNFNELAEIPKYISGYADSMMGGASRARLVLNNETKKSIRLKGKVQKDGFIGFVGLDINLSKSDLDKNVDLGNFSGISFEVNGNGEGYFFRLISSQVTDYNYHSAPFKTTGDWKTVTISFDELKQNPYYGKKMDIDPGTITNIRFEASDKSYDVDFSIRNINFIK
jgi:imidazolonepropionase-like amidohydrolase